MVQCSLPQSCAALPADAVREVVRAFLLTGWVVRTSCCSVQVLASYRCAALCQWISPTAWRGSEGERSAVYFFSRIARRSAAADGKLLMVDELSTFDDGCWSGRCVARSGYMHRSVVQLTRVLHCRRRFA